MDVRYSIFEGGIILMNRSSSQRMTAAALGLAGLSPITRSVGVVDSWNAKVLLEGAVLQFLWHPRLYVLMELATVDPTLFTLPLSNDLPSSLQRIGTKSSRVEWHLRTVNSTVDKVEVWRRESQATRVDFV